VIKMYLITGKRHKIMVICAVINCSNQTSRRPSEGHSSGSKNKVSYYRFPAVTDYYGKKDFELRKKHLEGYLAAISRDDINPATLVLEDHDYRVCSRHFVSGKPADLYDTTSPDWLPTLHMGHSKKTKNDQVVSANIERYERAAERDRKRILLEKIEDELPGIMSELIDGTISVELESIASQEIEISMQYIKAKTSHKESNDNDCQCGCASKVEELQKSWLITKLQ